MHNNCYKGGNLAPPTCQMLSPACCWLVYLSAASPTQIWVVEFLASALVADSNIASFWVFVSSASFYVSSACLSTFLWPPFTPHPIPPPLLPVGFCPFSSFLALILCPPCILLNFHPHSLLCPHFSAAHPLLTSRLSGQFCLPVRG